MQQKYFSQDEQSVGISEYASVASAIEGVTKYLVSDFIVNEISVEGRVIHLRGPFQEKQTQVVRPVSYEVSAEFAGEMAAVLGEEAAKAVTMLYDQMQRGQKIGEWKHVLPYRESRDSRVLVHDFVRERLNFIESTTLEKEGGIALRWNKRLRKGDPTQRHKHLHFTLWKSGIDTNGAIYRLSKVTGINMKLFSTAGLKDKRGVTTQLASVFNTPQSQLVKFYPQCKRNREIYIGDIVTHQQEPISVGHLMGNQFALIIRLLDSTRAQELRERAVAIADTGFINYFGLQRFGSCGTKSHQMGVRILKKEWKELVQDLLFANGDPQNTREYYDKQQYAEAESRLHSRYKIEKMVLQALSRTKGNHANAFQSLSRGVKTLYTHALQSYIWNRIVSRRLSLHGRTIQIGDLVAQESHKQDQRIKDKIDVEGDQIEEEMKDELLQIQEVIENENIIAVVVTPQNKHHFTCFDLVAPLYGPSAQAPKDCLLHPFIEEELKQLNLTAQEFERYAKTHCLQGRYRRMLVRPMAVQAQIIQYSHCKEQLQSAFYLSGGVIDVKEGKHCAVQTILQLPKSCYATMAMREMLHVSQTFDHQIALSRQYEALFKESYIPDKQDIPIN